MGNLNELHNTSNSFSFLNIEMDEFLPIIRLKNLTKYKQKGVQLNEDKKEVNLSKHLDGDKRIFKLLTLSSERNVIKLSFTIKKGGSNSRDEDGSIKIQISIKDESVKVSPKSFSAKYNSEFELTIEVKGKEKKEFYIDFYANDDKEDWNIGEYEDVHCGRIKYVYEYCVCEDWTFVAPVIPKEKFIGWGYKKVKKNCFDYVRKQLEVVGKEVKSPWWGTSFTMNDHIYQVYLEIDVAGMKKGVQKEQFINGVEYLKKTIQDKIPVMVGVDDGDEKYNTDKTTEHFVTVVGMGSDKNGNYFLFYDNAVGNHKMEIGTSSENKLYCKCSEFKLEGKGDKRIDYIQQSKKKKYIITQIRKTK